MRFRGHSLPDWPESRTVVSLSLIVSHCTALHCTVLHSGIVGTVFVILLAAHMLACIWFATGADDSSYACDGPRNATHIHGVLQSSACEWNDELGRWQKTERGWVSRRGYPEATSLGVKYIDRWVLLLLDIDIVLPDLTW